MAALNIVRGRWVGNSVVLTAPRECNNTYYTFSQLTDGKIIYTPVKPKHDGDKCEKLNI